MSVILLHRARGKFQKISERSGSFYSDFFHKLNGDPQSYDII